MEEFQRRGDLTYERDIEPHLRPEDRGKYVSIDIETGAYEMDANEIESTHRLRAREPDAQIWFKLGLPLRTAIRLPHPYGSSMIIGSVTADREAIVRLAIHGPAGERDEIDAVFDTGFDGWLTLPLASIIQLGLTWQRRGCATLGDGTACFFDVYEGIAIWDGQPRTIAVDEADTTPLIGMSLLEGFELTTQVRPQGDVAIAPLP
jgi:clan AA aspartic protease